MGHIFLFLYVLSNFELYFGLLNIVLCFQAYYNPLGNVCASVLEENWKFCFIFSLACSSLSYVGSGLSSVCARLCQDLWGAHTEFSSVQLSHSIVSNSLQPRGLQHARLPYSSPTPRAYSNSCPLSRWCHPTISSSVVPFSCLQSSLASVSFLMSQFFTSGGESAGASASALVLPMNIQDWFPLGWTGWISLLSKDLSRVFSNTTIQNHQFFGAQLSLWSNFHIHTWLPKKRTRQIFVSKIMSLLFNTLSRFVIAFLQGPTVF